ncbi:MAG: SH3 domain-containing protein [Lachnospiraceae bacterium]|nr:SH3 domain-containing protein [Lachnospiraceae bacterium]
MKKRWSFLHNPILTFLLILAILTTSTLGILTVPFSVHAYTEKIGYITADSLNVRSEPGTSNPAIGSVREGAVVTIIDEAYAPDGALWYKIRYNGSQEGYASSVYITVREPSGGGGDGSDGDFESMIAGFPESYKQDLRTIHTYYPKWRFIPVYTGLDWNEAVSQENVLGKSLISANSVSSWKSTQPGAYDWDTSTWRGLDGAAWVQASREITAYFMDPRSYLDANYIFVFLDYAYDPSVQTLDGLRRIVAGTFLTGGFSENGMDYSYPDVIMEVAAQTGMNPYVMASMIRVEIGVNGTSGSISGTEPGYEGLYNYYNVGAYATESMTAIQRGLWYAGQSGSYNRPWNTRYGAILGGAQSYAQNYVTKAQNTLYLKKFNVVSNPYYPLYTHQYMTNVQGASTEANVMARGYDEVMRDAPLTFAIPVYENMPESATVRPTGDGSPNNKLASLSVNGYSLTPAFNTDTLEYDVVVPGDVTSVTIDAAVKDGSAWVSGTGTYPLHAGVNTFPVVVTAQNGQQRTYQIHVAGSNGGQPVDPGDPSAATLNTSMRVSASAGTIEGLPKTPVSASEFVAALGVQNGSAQVLTASGEAQNGNVGTGNIVRILNASGNVQAQYTVILYGDANGDGRITSADLLRIQRGILGMVNLSGAYRTAADANRDGRVTSADLLRIQRAILGMTTIAQ